ncbi:MAG: hypothetical protein H8E21_03470 [Gammaproteobacteria bacterium]|nr:hypothetical protein [Gammaproteobacteria bacterium]MBL6999330.1 hypothetical protein [Gammaproteobacteria bacterium]
MIVKHTLRAVSVAALLFSPFAMAEVMSVADIHAKRADLAGQQVSVTGKVVKVNNGIMRRNFLHVQDGTGSGTEESVIVTSQQTANVGDQVSVTGKLTLDTDFTMGYFYPTLVVDAVITPAN